MRVLLWQSQRTSHCIPFSETQEEQIMSFLCGSEFHSWVAERLLRLPNSFNPCFCWIQEDFHSFHWSLPTKEESVRVLGLPEKHYRPWETLAAQPGREPSKVSKQTLWESDIVCLSFVIKTKMSLFVSLFFYQMAIMGCFLNSSAKRALWSEGSLIINGKVRNEQQTTNPRNRPLLSASLPSASYVGLWFSFRDGGTNIIKALRQKKRKKNHQWIIALVDGKINKTQL